MPSTSTLEKSTEFSKTATIDRNLILDELDKGQEQVKRARRRQSAFWRHEKVDVLPIIFQSPLSDRQNSIPNPDFSQAFHDPDLMICQQLRSAFSVQNAGADGVPSIRVNFGTGVLLSCVGLEQRIFPDKMPWLQDHLSLEEAAKLDPASIQPAGSFARGLEVMRHFESFLGKRVATYCMDTQGPFDLAHLLLGDEIFYLMEDDPALLHHVMEFCLELGLRTHRWMKEVMGEPMGALHHSNHLYAENMGVRICEDTTAIISPEAMDAFAMPYTRRLARAFQGAWVHYCGRNDHLTRRILAIPEVRGINFGHIPGHEDDHDFEADMKRISEAGKIYYGSWPRLAGENGAAFLKRMQRFAKEGSLLASGNPAVGPHGYENVASALEAWRSLS